MTPTTSLCLPRWSWVRKGKATRLGVCHALEPTRGSKRAPSPPSRGRVVLNRKQRKVADLAPKESSAALRNRTWDYGNYKDRLIAAGCWQLVSRAPGLELGPTGFIPPVEVPDSQADSEKGPKFVKPFKTSQLLEFQAAMDDGHAVEIQRFTSRVEDTLHQIENCMADEASPTSLEDHNALHTRRLTAIHAAGINAETVGSIDKDLQHLLQSALALAYNRLDTLHAKPEKRFLCRKDKKKLLELIACGKEARAAFQLGGQDPVTRRDKHATLKALRQERHALTKDIRIANAIARKARFQSLMDTKPKVAHGLVNGKLRDKIEPSILRQAGSNQILFKAPDVIQETHNYFKNQNQAPHPEPDSDTAHREPNYPWESNDALDAFKLESHVGRQGYGYIDLDEHIKNPTIFRRCLRGSKLGKTPGPDDICNEILRYLPQTLQMSIHKMLVLIWLTGHTPHNWKESKTVLLYKKGDPLDLSNFRPIALANTLYKLWTGVLTQGLSLYAEHFNLLSDCQEGFRKHRNTMRALQSTINVFEDAKIHKRNVFVLYTDYSNAFNTINQQKLLQVLHDLSFPNVAIGSIKDIYAEATTRVQTPAGLTAAIQVGRGVLQGDTLSPFLFNCFMEPLAHWLQVGGRGYEYGCLKMARAGLQTQMRCRTPCSSYADDSQIFCNTIQDLCLQADEIHKYATWGNLKLQPAKCATTGMPHAEIASGSVSSPLAYVGCEQLKKRLACVKIGPHQIPFAHPDKEPQKVLGVWITPTLNWKMQQRKLVDAAKDKSTATVECDASPKQKLAMIRTCLKAYITYTFPLGIQSRDDIADLDGIVARTAKRALRLPLSTPTGLVLQEKEACGAGVESLLVDYVQLGTAYLVRALNDQTKLGQSPRPCSMLRPINWGELRHIRLAATIATIASCDTLK